MEINFSAMSVIFRLNIKKSPIILGNKAFKGSTRLKNQLVSESKLLNNRLYDHSFKNNHDYQKSVHDQVYPQIKAIQEEKRKMSEEYTKEIIRNDSYWYRKNLVSYSSFGVLAGSYLLSSRGRLRFSLRNASLFYLATSYIV